MPKKKVLMAVLALIFAVMQILPAFANELEDKQEIGRASCRERVSSPV